MDHNLDVNDDRIGHWAGADHNDRRRKFWQWNTGNWLHPGQYRHLSARQYRRENIGAMMKRLLLTSVLFALPHFALADVTIDALSAAAALNGSESWPIFQAANPAVRSSTTAIQVFVTGHVGTWSAVQTYQNSMFVMLGSSTGATTLTSANAGASNFTLTLPAITDTLVTLTATQTLTNTVFNELQTAGVLTAARVAVILVPQAASVVGP